MDSFMHISISIYIKDKRKNGFVRVRLLNYIIDTNITHTKFKVWTRRRSVNHKMWGYIIAFALNLDGKVDSVGYFEMHGSFARQFLKIANFTANRNNGGVVQMFPQT